MIKDLIPLFIILAVVAAALLLAKYADKKIRQGGKGWQ